MSEMKKVKLGDIIVELKMEALIRTCRDAFAEEGFVPGMLAMLTLQCCRKRADFDAIIRFVDFCVSLMSELLTKEGGEDEKAFITYLHSVADLIKEHVKEHHP